MTPRPVPKANDSRPTSAIYLGKLSVAQEASLPALPEPHSPTASSSGLPSPPATNSTGSGSTDGPPSNPTRRHRERERERERPLSLYSTSSSSTSTSTTSPTPSKRTNMLTEETFGSRDDFDADDDSTGNGDETARLDRRLVPAVRERKRDQQGLQVLDRAKHLAERNRMALNRLSSISRLSPSPRRSASPLPSTSSAASSSTSRLSRDLELSPLADQGRSGSETEREDSPHHSYSNSNSSATSSSHRPFPSSSTSSHTPPPAGTRLRHSSANTTTAPASPSRSKTMMTSATPPSLNNSPSRRRRNRTSYATVSSLHLPDFDEDDPDEDQGRYDNPTLRTTGARTVSERDLITQSALAAVANSRRSPTSARTSKRAALPRQFRSDLPEDEDVTARQSPVPIVQEGGRREFKTPDPLPPFRTERLGSARASRAASMRDTGRAGGSNPRWTSEDFRSGTTLRGGGSSMLPSTSSPSTTTTNNGTYSRLGDREEFYTPLRERKQTLRGGSAESALSPSKGRTLVGEGLRAAGIETKSSTTSGVSGTAGVSAGRRTDEAVAVPVPPARSATLRGDAFLRREAEGRDKQRDHSAIFGPRPATSMGEYRYLDLEERRHGQEGQGHHLARHRSTFSYATPSSTEADELGMRVDRERDKERDRASSALAGTTGSLSLRGRGTGLGVGAAGSLHSQTPSPLVFTTQLHGFERGTSPFTYGTRRSTPGAGQPQPSFAQFQSEHTKLLHEALGVYETQLAKIPPPSPLPSSGSHPPQQAAQMHTELLRTAQGMVLAAERLCTMLRVNVAKAVESEVEAEVRSVDGKGHSADALEREQETWRKISGDYREASRVCDELVRGMTGFLVGTGRLVKDLNAHSGQGTCTNTVDYMSPPGPSVRSRSVFSTEPEDETSPASRRSADVRSTGVKGNLGSASGRVSGASRGSLEQERDRRPESVLARASPATFQRLNQSRESNIGSDVKPSTQKRLSLTPREREEPLFDYMAYDSEEVEPSPTPSSRIRPTRRERTKTLTPLTVPKPMVVSTPEETNGNTALSPRHRTSTIRPSNASSSSLVPPSMMDRSESGSSAARSSNGTGNGAASPASRVSLLSKGSGTSASPSGTGGIRDSLSTLRDRIGRVAATVGVGGGLSGSSSRIDLAPAGGRRSLEGVFSNGGPSSMGVRRGRENSSHVQSLSVAGFGGHAADRAAVLSTSGGRSSERRRTVTEIWPGGGAA